ncbi:hypothetical protein CEXT_289331 [Caerostris extrusa]|uniref:Uncharacterized protein n=1 Tax=Caerostris extrusa TaxID=172846 RepID=A0AAV4RJN1_CAEEX|nr:hypothetical protein CEXT_289331 [Caerostris extrusa]
MVSDKVAVKLINNIAENILEIESEYGVLSAVGGQGLVPEFHGTYLHSPKGAKAAVVRHGERKLVCFEAIRISLKISRSLFRQ